MNSGDEPPVEPARSALMRRVGRKNTEPELTVRRSLHAAGLRLRLHRRYLPGSPDIVLPRHRAVVFVHGCFWHRHEGCKRTTTPKTREEFWNAKFDANVRRDLRAIEALRDLGWRVHTVWEREAGLPRYLDSLVVALKGPA